VVEIHVLSDGYARDPDRPEGGDRVGSTVGFVRDGDILIVIDPGMVRSREESILQPLVALGVEPAAVTDVVISHHHPDHTLNAALFPGARVHDHWAIYRDDEWLSRPAEGFELSANVALMETPGHTPQDITTLVRTAAGIVAFTHLWWTAEGPPEDPLASDPALIHVHRERVLGVAAEIVPGHGPRFVPGPDTPR